MTLPEKLEAKIKQLEKQREDILFGPLYTDCEYERAEGKEMILEEIIEELKELLKWKTIYVTTPN